MPRYEVNDGNACDSFDAADDDAALRWAEDWLADGEWERDTTRWLRASVFRLDGDEAGVPVGKVKVTLQPEPPKCCGDSHAWESPYSVVGGIKENPGVFGSGGGVRTREVCRHCGAYMVTDTWATDPYDGSQGHYSEEYLPPDEASIAWVNELNEEVSDG